MILAFKGSQFLKDDKKCPLFQAKDCLLQFKIKYNNCIAVNYNLHFVNKTLTKFCGSRTIDRITHCKALFSRESITLIILLACDENT